MATQISLVRSGGEGLFVKQANVTWGKGEWGAGGSHSVCLPLVETEIHHKNAQNYSVIPV